MASKSDQELIAQIQAGRRNALGELFDRYSPALYDFIYRIIGDRDQTARLLEEVFERIPSALTTLEPQAPIRGWLYSLAREAALTLLRQKDWLDALPPSDEPSVSGLVGDIWRAARGMPAFHRAVLAVEELHGLSPTEKARALGVARTDLNRLIDDARRSFDNQFDLQARQQGRPLSTQIDPERIWGMHRRIGTTGTLFGYLPTVVLPDSLAAMVRGKVLKSAKMSAPSGEPEPFTMPPRPEPVILTEPAFEPGATTREPEPPVPPRVTRTPEVEEPEPAPVVIPEESGGEGCAWRLVGIALLVALIVTALAVGVGYLLTRDTTAPTITRIEPAENAVLSASPSPGATTTNVRISVTYADDRGIDPKGVRLVLDGRDVAPLGIVTNSSVTYSADLDPGVHVVLAEVKDTSGNVARRSWQFSIGAPPEPTPIPTAIVPTVTPTLLPTLTPPPSPTSSPTILAPPTILDFSATQTVITRGTPVLITWNVQGADQVFLDQDKVDPLSNRLVSPTTTTTYHLIANNAGGPVERSLTITVQEFPDLIVSDITLGPSNQIIFTIANVGTAGVTRPFLIQVTANSIVVESDRPVSSIPAGQQAILTVPNYTVIGSQVVTVRVNSLQEVQESDYTNNELTRSLVGPTATPTLTVTPTPTNTPTLTATPTFTPLPTSTFTPTPTNTPPPTRTRTPTITPVPFAVTNVTAVVTPTLYSGACPGTFSFTGNITTNGAGNVTFRWERSDGIQKSPATVGVPSAGTIMLTDSWASAPSGSSWEVLHVLTPNDFTSSQATFTNSCH